MTFVRSRLDSHVRFGASKRKLSTPEVKLLPSYAYFGESRTISQMSSCGTCRVTPPASVSSCTSPKKKLIRRSDGADSTQEMHREALVRSGSDRSAPSTCQSAAQRSSGQGRRHRKRSYAGEPSQRAPLRSSLA